MVADREAGTPGPWRMRVNKRDDQDTCDVSICGDIFVLADLNGPQYVHQHANARRIARLPDLEAAYLTLAAENATLLASEAAIRALITPAHVAAEVVKARAEAYLDGYGAAVSDVEAMRASDGLLRGQSLIVSGLKISLTKMNAKIGAKP